jgi:predicted Zn-dependent peptidase
MTTQDFRKIHLQSKTIETVSLVEPEKYLLDNGVPVYLINAGTQEIVKIDLIFDAGSRLQDQSLQAQFTSKCLIEGTESFDSKTIAEIVDFYGAYLKPSVTRDDAEISLYSLNKHLEKLLPVFAEVALQPTFPEHEVQTMVQKLRQEYLVNMEKGSFIAQQHFSPLIHGKLHPYGKTMVLGDYENINSQVLHQFFTGFYKTAGFKIIVSGKVNNGLIKLLNRYFGQHKVTFEEHVIENLTNTPSGIPKHFIEKGDALQSALRIGKATINKHHPDFLPFMVVNTILGGYFGSRLMTNIREDKGYTYGIGSGLGSFKHAGMFFIGSEVGNDVTEKAIEQIFIEIEKLKSEPVKADELSLVKNYLLGTFLRSADGPFALADLFKATLDYDMDMRYYDTFLHTVKNITIKDIQEIAVKYLQTDSMITLVVGNPVNKE